MKNRNYLKGIILLLILPMMVSGCGKDSDTAVDLIGEWQRSDVSSVEEYKLIFNSDNAGFRTHFVGNAAGQGISSATEFNWTINADTLTMDFDEERISTNFDIDTNGQLRLRDLTELHFIKLE